MSSAFQHLLYDLYALHFVLCLLLTPSVRWWTHVKTCSNEVFAQNGAILQSYHQPWNYNVDYSFLLWPPTKPENVPGRVLTPCGSWWISIHIPDAFPNISHNIWHPWSQQNIMWGWMILKYRFFYFRPCKLVKCFCIGCHVPKPIWCGIATGPRGDGVGRHIWTYDFFKEILYYFSRTHENVFMKP